VIWKGLGVLLGSAALIVAGIIGLARWIVPDEPDFSEGFATAGTTPEGSLDFVPSAIGGELEVTGARAGNISLEDEVGGPSFGLGNARTRIFFESDPLQITQMSHDGLAFFPEPEDCDFTVGELNEDVGIAAVQVICGELVDIRGNGTISLEGYLALPTDEVIERDLPELGGTVTVGALTWEIADANLGIYPKSVVEPVTLDMWTGDYVQGMTFAMERETEALNLAQVYWPQGESEVPAGACSISTELMVQVDADNSIHRLDFSCASVAVRGMGDVPIEGSVVFYRSEFADPQG
jgi:hypothetical protein